MSFPCITSCAILISTALCAPCLGQSAATNSATATGAASRTDSQTQPALRRAPLLREGSKLVDVEARLLRDPHRESWKISIPTVQETGSEHELTLLPSTRLQEMMQIVESSKTENALFRITGEVFAFHGRNYLLVTHAPRIVNLATPNINPPAAPSSDSPPSALDTDDDSVDAIMRGLRESVGSMPRGTRSDATPETPALASPIDEGSMLVNRRGRVRRDDRGAWSFVFDADAEGLGDPSVMLLPCLLLETIEQRTKEQGMHIPLILTGRLTVFESRRFLIPTMFIIPRDRTTLNP